MNIRSNPSFGVAIAFVFAAIACDREVDVVALERRAELLELQQLEQQKQQSECDAARIELDRRLQEEVEARGRLQTDLRAVEATLTAAQRQLDELDASAADRRVRAGRARPRARGRLFPSTAGRPPRQLVPSRPPHALRSSKHAGGLLRSVGSNGLQDLSLTGSAELPSAS